MSFQDELDRERRRKSDDGASSSSAPGETPKTRKKKGQDGQFGDALRSVYQRTINEDIPPEMLDLLGKLG